MQYTIIEQSEGEQVVLGGVPSMRKIKAALGITGRRVVRVAHARNEKEYRLIGTYYTFTVITVG